jgi:hypothetical protein
MSTGVFAVPQNLKKKSKKAKGATSSAADAPIVLELAFEADSGFYSLEFAGRKCKGLTFFINI